MQTECETRQRPISHPRGFGLSPEGREDYVPFGVKKRAWLDSIVAKVDRVYHVSASSSGPQ